MHSLIVVKTTREQQIQRDFWFLRMRNYVKDYISAFIECCYNKKPTGSIEGPMHINKTIAIPFRTINIDHLGPFPRSGRGNQYIIGISDSFSKYLVIKPVKTTKTLPVINMINELTCYFGLPTRIVTDRGTAFTSKTFIEYCKSNAIQHILNAVRTPRANGQIERANQVI